jgi:hypothetical protein
MARRGLESNAHLITPSNSVLMVIDYQPTQFSSIRSMDPALLLENIVSTVNTDTAL